MIPTPIMLLIDAVILTAAIILLTRKFYNKGEGKWKKIKNSAG
jgi:hypothetical protein